MSRITFTNLFIRHNLKTWNRVEVLSKLMLPLAVFVSSLSVSSQCSSVVRPLPASHCPEHQGIMGCLGELQGEKEENSCYVKSRREKGGQYVGL